MMTGLMAAALFTAQAALAGSVPLPPRPPAHKLQQPVSAPVAQEEAPAAVPIPVRKPGALKLKVGNDTFLISKLIDRFRAKHRLTEEDAARYANIFAFQDNGDIAKADAEIGKLSDYRLMGHVLFQRYMGPYYSSSYEELADWMKNHADHPGADKIYDLATRRQPDGTARLTRPRIGRGVSARQDFDVGQLAQPFVAQRKLSDAQRDTVRTIRRLLRDSRPTAAVGQLAAAKSAGHVDGAMEAALKADIAQSYFHHGKFANAYALARESSDRLKDQAPLAGWIAGLSAWRKGDYDAAATYFARTARSGRASAWMAAAGAHWTARSLLRARKPEKVGHWLMRAAEYPRTFYGIISLKALGLEQSRFDWEVPGLDGKYERALSAHPAGRRALALADAGNYILAAAELNHMNPGNDATLREAMVVLAVRSGVPDSALRMGSAFRSADGRLYDAALYPDVPWKPPGRDFAVDRALVHAFIRQESRFDPTVSNRSSGAVGLMQLMPATAAHVARKAGQKIESRDIRDPLVNIDLGQKYLRELLDDPAVGGNLFKLAAAYNAGPGKLARWVKEDHGAGDPLLFIETIPVAETRIFIERVMTNYWIYRLKYGQTVSSLDSVASGAWPVYLAQDIRRGRTFAEAR